MPQVDDALELAAGRVLDPRSPEDDALLSLLASMACSDGQIHDRELDFLVKIRSDLPDRQSVADWTLAHARPVDLGQLAAVIRRPDHQWKALRFAARMAWKDGELAEEEYRDLEALAGALELPHGAVERVLREMSPDDGKRFTAERILRTLMDVHWDAVQLAGGELTSPDLLEVAPPRLELVARVGLERVEVLALATQGVVARFQEGSAFIPWGNLVTYTHERGLGSALTLHTEEGITFTLVDRRLSGLATLLDRLLDLDGDRRQGQVVRIDTLRRGE